MVHLHRPLLAAALALLGGLRAPTAAAAELGLAVTADGTETSLSSSRLPTAPPISLDVRDADIRSVLRLFAAHAGLNLVLDDGVQGTVTASLEEVPWDQALAAVLLTQGLAAVPSAGETGTEGGGPPAVWVVRPVGAN